LAHDGHDEVVHDGIDDLPECGAGDDTDRQIQDVALQGE
jgi:hypothetical protein